MFAASILTHDWKNILIVRPTRKMLRERCEELLVFADAKAWGLTDEKGDWEEGFQTVNCLHPSISQFDHVDVSWKGRPKPLAKAS